ncbi:P44/Msp2 family outer membrane protein [Wolbachia endosymbiont of Cruorifilaria tuberocauda]|uniref:P44/Msp2 family outer membrane protein n=1 Tax=Wolbachia endosymbiont of Cruorifilaria tuberocauda TaxID=1812111 RepID=UPI001589B081|nr:P44/Msp2 family outer membrane protein [Wolbachia endosymbiont of Cruorifilaria tuberocauda]QKX01791.1 P44/Msp2 family outer membrane protein [Wolbachia endosymbiont of Cruorifilaria tuberocauda]
MSNKRTLVVVVFVLLLSRQSFCGKAEGFYFSSRYYSQLFNNVDLLKVRKIGNDSKENMTINKMYIFDKIRDQKSSEYKVDYNLPFAGSIVFGYERNFGNSRYGAELEGVFSSIKIENVGLKSNRMSILYFKGIGKGLERKTYMYATKVVDNDQIGNISVMVNACFCLKSDNSPLFHYIDAGVGLTKMKMFREISIGPAYQLKTGFCYHIIKDMNLCVGYRYFGTLSKKHKLKADLLGEVKPDISGERLMLDNSVKGALLIGVKKQEDISTSNGLFTMHGIEAGITFYFANKA